MGVFTDDIVVKILPGEEFPYEIYKSFEFHLGYKQSGYYIECEKGFRYNGASFPRAMWWLLRPSDLSLLQCAAIHDKAFRTGVVEWDTAAGKKMYRSISRKVANQLMAEAMRAKKVPKWKQFLVNAGLMIGSGPSWEAAKPGHLKETEQ